MEGPQACLLLTTILMGVALLFRSSTGTPRRASRAALHGPRRGRDTLRRLPHVESVGHRRPRAEGTRSGGRSRTRSRNRPDRRSLDHRARPRRHGLSRIRYRHRHFLYTAAALLQAVLNGFAGLTWLAAGAVAAVAAGILGPSPFASAPVPARQRPSSSSHCCPSRPALQEAEEKPAPAVAAPATDSAPGHVSEQAWPPEFRRCSSPRRRTRRSWTTRPARASGRCRATRRSCSFRRRRRARCSPAHLATLLGLDIDDRKVELLLGDNCVLCHSNPDLPDEILFKPRAKGDPYAHLDLNEIVSDVHFRGGLMCAGCHGGKPTDAEMSAEIGKRWPASDLRHKDRSSIPEFCAAATPRASSCGATTRPFPWTSSSSTGRASTGSFSSGKRTEGRAVRELPRRARDPAARQHELPRLSREHPGDLRQVPRGRGLHEGLHARRRQDADPDESARAVPQEHRTASRFSGSTTPARRRAMAATENHAALPPHTEFVSQVCRNCHAANGNLFDGSPHKKAFQAHGWPECETCHGKHDIAGADRRDARAGLEGPLPRLPLEVRQADLRRDGHVLLQLDHRSPRLARRLRKGRGPPRRARLRRRRASVPVERCERRAEKDAPGDPHVRPQRLHQELRGDVEGPDGAQAEHGRHLVGVPLPQKRPRARQRSDLDLRSSALPQDPPDGPGVGPGRAESGSRERVRPRRRASPCPRRDAEAPRARDRRSPRRRKAGESSAPSARSGSSRGSIPAPSPAASESPRARPRRARRGFRRTCSARATSRAAPCLEDSFEDRDERVAVRRRVPRSSRSGRPSRGPSRPRTLSQRISNCRSVPTARRKAASDASNIRYGSIVAWELPWRVASRPVTRAEPATLTSAARPVETRFVFTWAPVPSRPARGARRGSPRARTSRRGRRRARRRSCAAPPSGGPRDRT